MMSSQTNWGGGEQFLWSLGQGLAKRGHQVLWIAPPKSVLLSKLQSVESSILPVSGRSPSPLSILRLRNAIQQHQIDVLHLNDSHAVTWGALSTLTDSAFRRVAVKHTNFPIRSSAKYNWFVDRVACVSKTVYDTCLDGGILQNKLQVITGSVPANDWIRAEQRERLVKLLQVDMGRKLIVSVGNLIQCKGYDRLLGAIRDLKAKYPEILVAVFGEGPERANIEKSIAAYGIENQVRLLGFQNDPEQWIAGADLFVHPALTEGLPLVAMHAQMQGVPMVASDVGGLTEMLRSPTTGSSLGWIVDIHVPDSLQPAIARAFENPIRSQKMADQAKQLAYQRYSLDRMIVDYEEFYFSVLRTNKTNRRMLRKAA